MKIGAYTLRLNFVGPVPDTKREHIRPSEDRIYFHDATIEPARPSSLRAIQLKAETPAVNGYVVKHKKWCSMASWFSRQLLKRFAAAGIFPIGGRATARALRICPACAVSRARHRRSQRREHSSRDCRYLSRTGIDRLVLGSLQHAIKKAG